MKKASTTSPRVALLIESSRTYGRGILRGIAHYAHAHGPWSIFSEERELHGGIPRALKQWQGDGIIARIENRRMARELLGWGVPVVDVLGNEPYPAIAGFDTDAVTVARLAGEFFTAAGFRAIAFCGYRGIPFSDRRERALAAHLARQGRRLLVCSPKPAGSFARHIQAVEQSGMTTEKVIADWLRKQPRPLALFACNDVRARQVLNACREQGLRVPEEIAVMGVDNDDVLCSLCEPSLTSIQPDTERLGFAAAACLHHLIRGGSPPAEIQQLQPLGIIERDSTDVISVADPIVVRALRFIRDQLAGGIGVKEVLAEVGRSRTDLENRFHRHLQTSVRTEIVRQRLLRARSLLRQTDLRIDEVARRSGLGTAGQLCRLFRARLKTTPGHFRETSRASDVSPSAAQGLR